MKKFVEIIVIYNNYSEEQREEIEYTLRMIKFESLKMIAVMLLFALIGYFKECISVLIVMGITKPFIGGYHEDSQIK